MSSPSVRLSVTRVSLDDITRPGQLLLDVQESSDTLVDRAVAWADVRGYTDLFGPLRRLLGDSPPESGFAALVNKKHSLLIFATWPWCPDVRRPAGTPKGWP